MMRMRYWLAAALVLGTLATGTAGAEDEVPPAAAVELPQACADAGIATGDECNALIASQKAAAQRKLPPRMPPPPRRLL